MNNMKTQDLAMEVYTRQSLPTSRDVLAMLYRQRRVILSAFALVLIATALSASGKELAVATASPRSLRKCAGSRDICPHTPTAGHDASTNNHLEASCGKPPFPE